MRVERPFLVYYCTIGICQSIITRQSLRVVNPCLGYLYAISVRKYPKILPVPFNIYVPVENTVELLLAITLILF